VSYEFDNPKMSGQNGHVRGRNEVLTCGLSMRTMEPNTERKSRVRYPRGDCKLSNRISCMSWRTLWDAFT
jgi:hypothetical protein